MPDPPYHYAMKRNDMKRALVPLGLSARMHSQVAVLERESEKRNDAHGVSYAKDGAILKVLTPLQP